MMDSIVETTVQTNVQNDAISADQSNDSNDQIVNSDISPQQTSSSMANDEIGNSTHSEDRNESSVQNNQTDHPSTDQPTDQSDDLTNSNDKCKQMSKSDLNNPKFETSRMKDYLKKAKQATSQYNKMINQERNDERRICLDLQTYTLHYPLGLGADNRMLKKHIETGRCDEISKYPIAVLPGHYQNSYRKFSSEELKYLPINTVVYGPVITDTDKLPPLLTRIEEDSFSDSDTSSTSTEHSCCCDEKSCKRLKLANGCVADDDDSQKCSCLDELSSSSLSDDDERELDEQPPKLVNVFHFAEKENAICDVCKKNGILKADGTADKLVHCSVCTLSFHQTCLDMSSEMIHQIQLYPWECSRCKRCVVCLNDHYESNMLICDLCDQVSPYGEF